MAGRGSKPMGRIAWHNGDAPQAGGAVATGIAAATMAKMTGAAGPGDIAPAEMTFRKRDQRAGRRKWLI